MRVQAHIDIAAPIAEVFAFVSDARNDPEWCPKVESVEGPAPKKGARYVVVHRPAPLAPSRTMDLRLERLEPPREVEWHADDGADTNVVTYRLEERGGRTRLTQASEIRLATPRFMDPFMKLGVRNDVRRQLRLLRKLLEGR